MSPAYRRLLKVGHFAHLYLTLFGLLLILFFAVTGFVLNNEEKFGLDRPRTWDRDGQVPTHLLAPVDRLAVVELLRREYGAAGALGPADEPDEQERARKGFRVPDDDHPEDPITVTFNRPGFACEATISREEGRLGQLHVEYRSTGWAGVAGDLHKGKGAGRAWRLLMDAVCVLLVLVSLTGLFLWYSLKGRGRYGLWVILAGGMAGVAVYYWGVP